MFSGINKGPSKCRVEHLHFNFYETVCSKKRTKNKENMQKRLWKTWLFSSVTWLYKSKWLKARIVTCQFSNSSWMQSNIINQHKLAKLKNGVLNPPNRAYFLRSKWQLDQVFTWTMCCEHDFAHLCSNKNPLSMLETQMQTIQKKREQLTVSSKDTVNEIQKTHSVHFHSSSVLLYAAVMRKTDV